MDKIQNLGISLDKEDDLSAVSFGLDFNFGEEANIGKHCAFILLT